MTTRAKALADLTAADATTAPAAAEATSEATPETSTVYGGGDVPVTVTGRVNIGYRPDGARHNVAVVVHPGQTVTVTPAQADRLHALGVTSDEDSDEPSTGGPLTASDVASMTVTDVETYAETHPDEVEQIAAYERDGKARTTLLEFLDKLTEPTE